MTKQQEIREGIEKKIKIGIDFGFSSAEIAKEVIEYEDSQGVVIKVDGDTTDFIKCPCDDCTAEHKLIDEWGYFCDLACGQRSQWISRCVGANEARNAGYVAVEPLIEEETIGSNKVD